MAFRCIYITYRVLGSLKRRKRARKGFQVHVLFRVYKGLEKISNEGFISSTAVSGQRAHACKNHLVLRAAGKLRRRGKDVAKRITYCAICSWFFLVVLVLFCNNHGKFNLWVQQLRIRLQQLGVTQRTTGPSRVGVLHPNTMNPIMVCEP